MPSATRTAYHKWCQSSTSRVKKSTYSMAQENFEYRSTAPRKNLFIPNWMVKHKQKEDREGITVMYTIHRKYKFRFS